MTWPLISGGETAPRGHLLSSALGAPCIGQWCPLSGFWVTEPPMENGPTVAFGRGLRGVEQPCPLGTVLPIGWRMSFWPIVFTEGLLAICQ